MLRSQSVSRLLRTTRATLQPAHATAATSSHSQISYRRTFAAPRKRATKKKAAAAGAEPRTALSEALRSIRSKYGSGSIMSMKGPAPKVNVDTVSTGSLRLDQALGIGGLPFGRIIEVFGPESSGKTTLALSVVAQAQKQGLPVTFIDAEHAIDPEYAAALGVDMEELLLSQPNSGEEALDIALNLVRGGVRVIVIDSVAALVPQAEIDGDIGDHHIALQARLMSQACRKLTAALSQEKAMIIFINQLRHKVGVIFGSPETTPGGMALKFYSSVRLDIRKTGQIKQADKVVGHSIRIKVVKNKLAPPLKTAEFDMIFGEGISKTGEILDAATSFDIVQKSGAWFSYNGRKFAQGREAAKNELKSNTEFAEELEKKIKAKMDDSLADLTPEDFGESDGTLGGPEFAADGESDLVGGEPAAAADSPPKDEFDMPVVDPTEGLAPNSKTPSDSPKVDKELNPPIPKSAGVSKSGSTKSSKNSSSIPIVSVSTGATQPIGRPSRKMRAAAV